MNTEKALLDFMDTYREVRGFRPTRIHIGQREWLDLMMQQSIVYTVNFRGALGHSDESLFDGARIVKFWNQGVVAAIRAWDVLPYGEPKP